MNSALFPISEKVVFWVSITFCMSSLRARLQPKLLLLQGTWPNTVPSTGHCAPRQRGSVSRAEWKSPLITTGQGQEAVIVHRMMLYTYYRYSINAPQHNTWQMHTDNHLWGCFLLWLPGSLQAPLQSFYSFWAISCLCTAVLLILLQIILTM